MKKIFSVYIALLILIFLITYGLSCLPWAPCKHFGIEIFVENNINIFRYIADSLFGVIFIFGIVLFRREKLFWLKMSTLAVFILIALFFIHFVFFAATSCSLDARQKAHIAEIRAAEDMYFDKYGRYTFLEELVKEAGVSNINDEFTKKPYKIEVVSNGMNFWIKAYLPQAEEWYICDKDQCFLAISL